MNILITGANGFVGKNLFESLKNIRDGKDRTHDIKIDEIFGYDIDTPEEKLDEYVKNADFVFHLAGVNRPKEESEFMEGNFGFTSVLLEALKKYSNKAPVMVSSSIQAELDNPYGKSKKAGEDLIFEYAKENGVKALVYRFPNVFGKWCRPNYNSAVATFCHNIAHDLPITVNDRAHMMTLVYIDDVVNELIAALEGGEHRCDYAGLTSEPRADGRFCHVPVTHRVTLGRIAALLNEFKTQSETHLMPEIPAGSFEKKLYSTFLSYLPPEKAAYELKMNCDSRGSFTELIKTASCGQISVNVSNPGVTKGQHWHNTKWELFIVVSGHGLIRQRRIGGDEITEYEVSGDKIEAVHMLPGYTHSIVNLSDTEKLVTVMWANESFDPAHPDTFFEEL